MRIKILLHNFFVGVRSVTYVILQENWKLIRQLQNHVRILFRLEKIYFTTNDGVFLSPYESIKVIEESDILIAHPLSNIDNVTTHTQQEHNSLLTFNSSASIVSNINANSSSTVSNVGSASVINTNNVVDVAPPAEPLLDKSKLFKIDSSSLTYDEKKNNKLTINILADNIIGVVDDDAAAEVADNIIGVVDDDAAAEVADNIMGVVNDDAVAEVVDNEYLMEPLKSKRKRKRKRKKPIKKDDNINLDTTEENSILIKNELNIRNYSASTNTHKRFRLNSSSDMSTHSLEYPGVNDLELQLAADGSDEINNDIEIQKIQPKIIHAIVNEDNLNNILDVTDSDSHLNEINLIEDNVFSHLKKLNKYLDTYKFDPLYEFPDINDLLTFKLFVDKDLLHTSENIVGIINDLDNVTKDLVINILVFDKNLHTKYNITTVCDDDGNEHFQQISLNFKELVSPIKLVRK